MTRDFYKAIKGKEFPQIKIEFQKFVLVDQVDENPNQKNVPATISITLAGKNNVYTIPLKQFKVGKDQLSIKGNLNLKMTDFNIIPPTALFGAVKTDDAIEIEFAITFVLE